MFARRGIKNTPWFVDNKISNAQTFRKCTLSA
jgi:hypothetical protein